jgi:hypothetical protein
MLDQLLARQHANKAALLMVLEQPALPLNTNARIFAPVTKAGEYWLIEAIFSHQCNSKAQADEFQVWTLVVDQSTNDAVLTMSDGKRSKTIIEQKIEYTDFPLAKVEFWFVAHALYLRSEHQIKADAFAHRWIGRDDAPTMTSEF